MQFALWPDSQTHQNVAPQGKQHNEEQTEYRPVVSVGDWVVHPCHCHIPANARQVTIAAITLVASALVDCEGGHGEKGNSGCKRCLLQQSVTKLVSQNNTVLRDFSLDE